MIIDHTHFGNLQLFQVEEEAEGAKMEDHRLPEESSLEEEEGEETVEASEEGEGIVEDSEEEEPGAEVEFLDFRS